MGHRKKNHGQKCNFWLEWKKTTVKWIKTTKAMQGRIKNTVKWKINYESYA